MKITKTKLESIIREQINMLNENINPIFNAQNERTSDNIVAAIYFSWVKQDNNNSSFWNKVTNILQEQNCILVNYVVTDSVCEFEFTPSTPSGQAELEDARNRVEDALEILPSEFTSYDVYVVGN